MSKKNNPGGVKSAGILAFSVILLLLGCVSEKNQSVETGQAGENKTGEAEPSDYWSLWGFEYPYNLLDEWENPEAGDDVHRVVRGGAFGVIEDYVRCAYRFGNLPGYRSSIVGFRLVVAPVSL